MELRFNQEVGSSEVDALLSEVTKDGKIGDLEFSKLVPVEVVDVLKGQLFFQTNHPLFSITEIVQLRCYDVCFTSLSSQSKYK